MRPSRPGVTLRPITAADMPFLRRLYGTTREDELKQVDWTDEQKEAFVDQQFAAQHAHYQEHYPDASWDVVLVDGVPAGRLYREHWTREIRIIDIAIAPGWRRGGLGTSLLRDVFREADGVGKAVSIHVEMFNPARRLYERLGFEYREEKGVYFLMERAPGAPEAAEAAPAG
jgi:ribosomal protein S18 acetylase RimI-like enzyme